MTLKNRATNGEVSGTGFTNAAGQAMQFTYGASGITGVTYPGSTTADVTIAYSGARVSSVQTPAGSTTYASVDGVDNGRSIRTVTVTDPAAKATVYVFDLALERMLSRTDPLARKTQWTYDSLGRVTRITQPGGEYTKFVYDARGNVTETRQVARAGSNLGDIVSTARYPASCTNAVTCNQPSSTTAANGGVTDYEYDSTHGNVTKVTGPAASGGLRPETRYAYESKRNTTTGADIYRLTGISTCRTTASCVGTADETTTTISYESGNLLPTAQTIAGSDGGPSATTAFGYDAIGNVTSIDGPLSGTADSRRITYDVLRRPTAVIAPDPDGAGALPHPIVRMTYDARGRISEQEQGRGNADGSGFTADRKVAFTYDDANRKTAERAMSGDTVFTLTQFGYDSAGRLACTAQRMNPDAFATTPASACDFGVTGTDGPDRIIRTTYNDAGQVTVVRRGDKTDAATEDQYAYHADGTLGTVTDGRGNVTAYTQDGFARPVRTCYQTASSTACAGSPDDYEQLTYAANGNPEKRRLRDGREITFSYDLLGRVTKKEVPDGCPPGQTTGCPPASATRDVDYGYDLLGHLTSATFSGTSEGVSATYDALGRMTGTTTTMGGTARTLTYAYDAAGNRTKLTHPDGMTFGYERDSLGRNTRITETIGGTTREVLNLAYYANGDRAWFGHGANGRGHGYDPLGRLTSYNLQRNENGSILLDGTVLEYNAASQIRRQNRTNDDYGWTGAINIDRSYTTNGLNQYSAAGPATFEYDKNGNLTKSVSPAGGTQAYGYDAENRLVSGPNGVTLSYDPLGRLFEIARNGTVASRFMYDGAALVLEYDGWGNRLQRHVHLDGADTPVLSYHASETSPRQLMPDHQGSIVSMTQHGWSRIVVNTYDEYGYPGANNTGRFQYTGQAWLAELGLYYYKARMYSPGMGRFLQTDPIGYGDGLNWYDYVGGDPVNRTDPSGLKWVYACVMDNCGYRWRDDGQRGGDQYNSVNERYTSLEDREAASTTADEVVITGILNNNPQSSDDAEADCVADPQSCIIVVAERGKRNVIHSDHRGVPTKDLLDRYHDPNTSYAEKKRLQQSLKGLGVKNMRNRLPRGLPGLNKGIIGPLFVMCLLAPVTCGLVDTDGNGEIDPDEII